MQELQNRYVLDQRTIASLRDAEARDQPELLALNGELDQALQLASR